ncbi:unnamed protein product [Rotaria magnacalcarata]|uniref:DYW domain-containing protein n=1 Tax=Rotaria magnacalcarata TaxID=392030 RepID=A0A819FTI8_9BILA|nr:unnamed protein product [Rotaria magnacalcarata]CAF3872049.1 unnamed protein product [Rotaria magnacalcarata]
MLLNKNIYSLYRYQCLLIFYGKRNKTYSVVSALSNNLNSTMKTLIDSKEYKKALNLLYEHYDISTDFTKNMAIKACTKLHDYNEGHRILQKLSPTSLNDPYIQTSLIHFYMQSHKVDKACHLFSTIVNKSNPMYAAMFKGFITNKMPEKVFDLYDKMEIEPISVTLNVLFNACARIRNDRAKTIGKRLLEKHFNYDQNDTGVFNSAIHMLMRFSDVNIAEDVFHSMKNKDIYTYGAMMKGYNDNEEYEKALNLYEKMNVKPNEIIYTLVFNSCAQLSNDRAQIIGKKLLEQMPHIYRNNNIILTSALHMLMKFGDVSHAECIFKLNRNKDIICYNAMMKGYNENQMFEKTLDLFESIRLDLNDITYTILLNACAQLLNDRAQTIGKKLLEQMPDIYRNNNIALTSALHMLMKFGDVSHAEHIFQLNREKSIVTYGTMMNGYCMNREPLKCLNIFNEIKQLNLVPDEIVFNIAIGACSQIGILSRCQTVVDQIPVHMQHQLFIQNALINMWGKSGSFVKAQQIFESVSNPNIITYNSMINVYGLNGMGSEAIELFRHVPANERDDISYICALNACSHSGLLAEARIIFNQVPTKTEKIITTMIDCLCRLFLFDEAEKLIYNYEKTNSPYVVMYMAMLSGARNHRNSQLCGKIYNRMKSLFPDEKQSLISGAVLLSNVYSSVGEYEQANDIRSYQRKELGVKVKAGMSWTEINGELAQFTAHDHSHPRSAEIFAEFDRLAVELIQHGHTFDGSWITRPINNDETIQSVLCGHSEKLAIGLNLIQRPVPSIIQVTKNLRICGDCHSVTKLIAKIRQVDIIIRDANRVHHFFQNGQCSCQDHF